MHCSVLLVHLLLNSNAEMATIIIFLLQEEDWGTGKLKAKG